MKIRGFIDYRIDAVVKFGGSLLNDADKCSSAIKALVAARDMGTRVLVIPGGGPTDKTIEALDARHPYAPDTHHRACARAQDQTGLMISDPVFSDALHPCETLEEVRAALDDKKVAVLLPSRLIFDLDPFERTWEITSDAMAAWFAWLVHAKQLVILTNVAGVFADGRIDSPEALIREISATDLMELGHTAVDACTAPFLAATRIDCWVLDGDKPERLVEALSGKSPTGTFIRGV